MPAATRRNCEYPGCVSGPIPEGGDTNGPYIILHPDCATRAEVTEDIKNHVEMVHTLPLKHQDLQTHVTEPPFRQAMSVPPNTWCYSTDAWNGYHSIPLDERDRHITTFLTPWGRLRCHVAPQGSISSGDGYTFWYDLIIRHIQRIKKCVDDVLGWATSLLQLFHDTAYTLLLHGILRSHPKPPKNRLGQREIEFVGFWLKKDGVKPTDETLSAISHFPRPIDLTGIGSWFGLVEQVAFLFSKTTLMEPFQKLLAKNAEYFWDDNLQQSFEIVKLVEEGVTSFKLDA